VVQQGKEQVGKLDVEHVWYAGAIPRATEHRHGGLASRAGCLHIKCRIDSGCQVVANADSNARQAPKAIEEVTMPVYKRGE
jgi:hypothetical protein